MHGTPFSFDLEATWNVYSWDWIRASQSFSTANPRIFLLFKRTTPRDSFADPGSRRVCLMHCFLFSKLIRVGCSWKIIEANDTSLSSRAMIFFLSKIITYIYSCRVRVGQRVSCRTWFSHSTTWVPRTELRWSGLAAGAFIHRVILTVDFTLSFFFFNGKILTW